MENLKQDPRPVSPWSPPGTAGSGPGAPTPGLWRPHEGHLSAGCVPPSCPSEPTQNVSCWNKRAQLCSCAPLPGLQVPDYPGQPADVDKVAPSLRVGRVRAPGSWSERPTLGG